MTKAEKTTYVCSVTCPCCSKIIDILKRTRVITPAEPADKEETFYAQGGVQTTLDSKEA